MGVAGAQPDWPSVQWKISWCVSPVPLRCSPENVAVSLRVFAFVFVLEMGVEMVSNRPRYQIQSPNHITYKFLTVLTALLRTPAPTTPLLRLSHLVETATP